MTMGNVCCRSRAASNEDSGAGTANSPADSSNGRGDAHASNEDKESVAPADVAIGTANLVVDGFLLAGGAVPVVGDFFDLIAHFKDQWMELVGRGH